MFGATESAKEIYTEIAKDYKIIYFCDNDSSKWGKKLIILKLSLQRK